MCKVSAMFLCNIHLKCRTSAQMCKVVFRLHRAYEGRSTKGCILVWKILPTSMLLSTIIFVLLIDHHYHIFFSFEKTNENQRITGHLNAHLVSDPKIRCKCQSRVIIWSNYDGATYQMSWKFVKWLQRRFVRGFAKGAWWPSWSSN